MAAQLSAIISEWSEKKPLACSEENNKVRADTKDDRILGQGYRSLISGAFSYQSTLCKLTVLNSEAVRSRIQGQFSYRNVSTTPLVLVASICKECKKNGFRRVNC